MNHDMIYKGKLVEIRFLANSFTGPIYIASSFLDQWRVEIDCHEVLRTPKVSEGMDRFVNVFPRLKIPSFHRDL